MIRGKMRPTEDKTLVLVINMAELQRTCQRCSFSLVCLSGKRFNYSYICSVCEAIWVDDIQTQVDCDAFEPHKAHEIYPGCPVCEPLEIHPDDLVKIVGYCGKEHQEKEEQHRAADEK